MEYAARAGTRGAYFSGDITPRTSFDCLAEANLDSIAWYCHNSGGRAHPVARKTPNAWGLYDTSGNVAEWCTDQYKPSGYGHGPLLNPDGQAGASSELTLHAPDQVRVTRGGDYLMPAHFSKNDWHTALPDHAYGANVGVRLARTLRDD